MSTSSDERPPVWVGHVVMQTNVLEQSRAFRSRVDAVRFFPRIVFEIVQLRKRQADVLVAIDDDGGERPLEPTGWDHFA